MLNINWEVNLYGCFVMIFLFLGSFIVQWVVIQNKAIHLRKQKNIFDKTAAQFTKELFPETKFIGKTNKSYFVPLFDPLKHKIYVEKPMFSTSTFDLAENSFLVSLLTLKIKSKKHNQFNSWPWFCISLFIISANIQWMLVFGWWLIIIILTVIWFLIVFLWYFIWQRQITLAINVVFKNLENSSTMKHDSMLDSSLKYWKKIIMWKVLIVFAQPWLSLGTSFWNWGKHE